MSVEDLLAERKALRQSIVGAMLDLKHALISSNLIRAQLEQKNILTARLRLKQISFEISTQYYVEDINCLQQIINKGSEI